MSIKLKLIISYLLLIISTVSIVGFLIAKKSKDVVFNEVTEKNQRITELINTTISVRNDLLLQKSYHDLNSGEKVLESRGDLRVDNTDSIKVGDYYLPVLYAGKEKISLDTKVVDNMTYSTGTRACIFLLNNNKLIRVCTNLIKDNQRAVGTYISNDSSIYMKIVNKEQYYGKITFNGETYISGFKPLLDKDKKVIGAISIESKALNYYLEDILKDIKIGQTGYVYVIDSKGNVVTHPNDKGENASEYNFVKEINSTRNGTIEYTYKGIHKLACYRYFEQWDWYIVTTANYDDLESSSKSILYIALISGLVAILLGGTIALLIANTLVKPINKLKSYMEIAGSGDLTVYSDINSKDEIGILSNSFNNMIAENKLLLEEIVRTGNMKTEFIANMSHELRTPLNIIFSIVQVFSLYINKGEALNADKLSNYTNIIKQNCYRLLRLTNNLIDITKFDSGFIELCLKNENIVEIVEEITLSTVQYIESISRTIIFDTDIEEKVMAFDREKIERILLNLIANSIKFTKPGDIIEVSLYGKEKDVKICVKDNGIGIPEDKISQIFERFKQVDPLLNRRHEGSGIGLAIVKSLVEAHGGGVDVKSKYREGAEFIISLPVTIVPNNDNMNSKEDLITQTNFEKIQIEFSDIYS